MDKVIFSQIQIDITSRCNMKCRHCRDIATGIKGELSLQDIEKILKFASAYRQKKFCVTISGGEPLLHANFSEIPAMLQKNNVNRVIITTNGSLVGKSIVERLNYYDYSTMWLISIDDSRKAFHDNFRRFKGAFDRALKSIDIIKKYSPSSTKVLIRTTIVPSSIPRMKRMAAFFYKIGADGVVFCCVLPAVNSPKNIKIIMNAEQKKLFLEQVQHLNNSSRKGFAIRVLDPLIVILDNKLNHIGGCSPCHAGINTFSARPNGNIVPCAAMNLPIVNIKGKSTKEISKIYINSPIIKKLLKKEYSDKCSCCSLKNSCRARAWSGGNYLGNDPDCWI